MALLEIIVEVRATPEFIAGADVERLALEIMDGESPYVPEGAVEFVAAHWMKAT